MHQMIMMMSSYCFNLHLDNLACSQSGRRHSSREERETERERERVCVCVCVLMNNERAPCLYFLNCMDVVLNARLTRPSSVAIKPHLIK